MVVTYRSAIADEVFDFSVRGQDVDITPLTLVGPAFDVAAMPGVRERSPAIRCGTGVSCQVAYRSYVDRAQTGTPPAPVTDPSVGADRCRGRVLSY